MKYISSFLKESFITMFSIGIRRETFNNWERRSPLTPIDVAYLVSQGVTVYVEKSSLRIFRDSEFQQAGAILVNDEEIAVADIILGIKQVPLPRIYPNKTYVFFSHVIKAQPRNMPMLDDILSKKVRLIDYEKIVNSQGHRLIKFSYEAGLCGCVDTLSGVGLRLLHQGVGSPFIQIGFTHHYASLNAILEEMEKIGSTIHTHGLHPSICPFIVNVTGSGDVSRGSLGYSDLLTSSDGFCQGCGRFDEQSQSEFDLYCSNWKERRVC
ncbi:hypothetical protein GEMRC1_002154 [Eukaryota sp. GEM-RC1]